MRPEVNLEKRLSKIFCLRLVSWEQGIQSIILCSIYNNSFCVASCLMIDLGRETDGYNEICLGVHFALCIIKSSTTRSYWALFLGRWSPFSFILCILCCSIAGWGLIPKPGLVFYLCSKCCSRLWLLVKRFEPMKTNCSWQSIDVLSAKKQKTWQTKCANTFLVSDTPGDEHTWPHKARMLCKRVSKCCVTHGRKLKTSLYSFLGNCRRAVSLLCFPFLSLNNRRWDKSPIIPRKTQQTDLVFFLSFFFFFELVLCQLTITIFFRLQLKDDATPTFGCSVQTLGFTAKKKKLSVRRFLSGRYKPRPPLENAVLVWTFCAGVNVLCDVFHHHVKYFPRPVKVKGLPPDNQATTSREPRERRYGKGKIKNEKEKYKIWQRRTSRHSKCFWYYLAKHRKENEKVSIDKKKRRPT